MGHRGVDDESMLEMLEKKKQKKKRKRKNRVRDVVLPSMALTIFFFLWYVCAIDQLEGRR